MSDLFGPVAARFTRTPEAYTTPPRLENWERAAIERVPSLLPRRSPGGSISGSGGGWDDCDE